MTKRGLSKLMSDSANRMDSVAERELRERLLVAIAGGMAANPHYSDLMAVDFLDICNDRVETIMEGRKAWAEARAAAEREGK